MADHQKVEMGYPTIPTNYQQPKVITSIPADDEVRRKNRIKANIAIGIVIVIIVIVISILDLTVRKVKIRMGNIYVQTLTAVPEPPLFDMSFATRFRVSNKNWGPSKSENGVVDFMYNGVQVGQLTVSQGKVGTRSTKTIDTTVIVSGSGFLLGNTLLGTEIKSGIFTLTGTAKVDVRESGVVGDLSEAHDCRNGVFNGV